MQTSATLGKVDDTGSKWSSNLYRIGSSLFQCQRIDPYRRGGGGGGGYIIHKRSKYHGKYGLFNNYLMFEMKLSTQKYFWSMGGGITMLLLTCFTTPGVEGLGGGGAGQCLCAGDGAYHEGGGGGGVVLCRKWPTCAQYDPFLVSCIVVN